MTRFEAPHDLVLYCSLQSLSRDPLLGLPRGSPYPSGVRLRLPSTQQLRRILTDWYSVYPKCLRR